MSDCDPNPDRDYSERDIEDDFVEWNNLPAINTHDKSGIDEDIEWHQPQANNRRTGCHQNAKEK